MPTDPIIAITSARAALLAAEQALTNATAQGGDLSAARKAVDVARAALDGARRLVFEASPGFEFVDPQYPLLMLPVRLETRIAANPNRLLVRIYPDDIHSDGHEPALTSEEIELQKGYWFKLETEQDENAWLAAWRELARRVGPLRALWLATGKSSVRRPPGWTRAAVARLLPDRFVAFAWTDLANPPIRAVAPHPVREPLALGPDPMRDDANPTQPLGGDSRWLHDFGAALAAGMALEIPLAPTDRVARLVALGVRAGVDPVVLAAELSSLFDAHRCTSGVSLLAPGEPTNALGEQRTAYRSQPDIDQIYLDELAYYSAYNRTQRRRASWEPDPSRRFDGQESAGFRLDHAFGLIPGTLGRLAGSNDEWAGQERLLRDLLAHVVTDGIEYMLSPSVSPEALGGPLLHLKRYVSAGGPFATLRIGQQPYGVLPVRLPDGARVRFPELVELLDALRAQVFDPVIDDVLRVSKRGTGDMDDPGRRLLEILRLDAQASGLGVRAVLGPTLLNAVLPSMRPANRDVVNSTRVRIRQLLTALGDTSPQVTAIANAGLFDDVAPVTLTLVGDAAALQQLHALRRPEPTNPRPTQPIPLWATELLDNTGGPQRPYTLIYELARQAVLHTADIAARQWLTQHAQVTGQSAPDFENPVALFGTMEKRLRAPAPDQPNTTIALVLDYGPDYVVLGQQRSALWLIEAAHDYWKLREDLRLLASLRPDRIEAALRAVVGLLAHRLDAWYTGFAMARLDELRAGGPSIGGAPNIKQGIAIGAFGWLDTFPRSGAQRAAGYVHAPSAQHAVTAAVLLSADKSHLQQVHGSAFAVDLSSARVRGALELLEGVRAGQPLGALLGYRIERSLSTAAPDLIAPLRSAAPLVANKRESSGLPAESVAADNVVDGLALLKLAGYNGTNQPDWTQLVLPGRNVPSLIEPILGDAAERIDALADLLLAEAVHHTLAGTPMRAGAAGDLLAGGPVGVPDEIEVARIGQRGTATTHKILTLFESEVTIRFPWTGTPRAGAEPALEAWLARQLPGTASIAVVAALSLADGTTAPVSTTLARLLDGAKSPKGLGAIDFVLLKSHVIERRLTSLLEKVRPAGSVGALTLLPGAKREGQTGDWSLEEVSELAATLRRLLGGARGVVPADLDALGQAAGVALDTRELENRFTALLAAAVSVRNALVMASGDEARFAALERAELFGIDAIPSAGPLDSAAAAVKRVLDVRIAEGDDLTRPLLDRIRSIGGPELLVVPRLVLNGTALGASFAANIGATPPEIRAFLARAAAVRDPVARLDAVLAQAEALAGAEEPYALAVAQHPTAPGERWTALPGPTAPARTSYVVARAATLDLERAKHFAGLFVDAWTEVVPQTELDTALVFDAAAASQAAPNAMLLLVPEEFRGPWTEEDILAYVLEALALAKLRAVDPDLVARAGQLLPALLLRDGDGLSSLADLWTTPVAP
jgi:hypothetical protein